MSKVLPIGIAASLFVAATAMAQTAAPQADHNAPTNAAVKHSSVKQTQRPASGANSFTEAQAKKRIAKAGYTNISDLKKDDAGLWKGSATKGGKSVNVALDYKGNVSSK